MGMLHPVNCLVDTTNWRQNLLSKILLFFNKSNAHQKNSKILRIPELRQFCLFLEWLLSYLKFCDFLPKKVGTLCCHLAAENGS
jgi:hypothetical protein